MTQAIKITAYICTATIAAALWLLLLVAWHVLSPATGGHLLLAVTAGGTAALFLLVVAETKGL